MFNTACKVYRQCFCCEWICGCPLESAYVSTDAAYSSIPTNDGSVNTADIVPCRYERVKNTVLLLFVSYHFLTTF